MKKYLYILIFLSFVFSCSNHFRQSEVKIESSQWESQESAFFGYDEDKVYDSSIIVKVASFNDEELDSFVASLKNLNIVEKSREKAFVDGEMYLTLKAFSLDFSTIFRFFNEATKLSSSSSLKDATLTIIEES